MTATENTIIHELIHGYGIYLLEMTTTENCLKITTFRVLGIYLFEMTATENNRTSAIT